MLVLTIGIVFIDEASDSSAIRIEIESNDNLIDLAAHMVAQTAVGLSIPLLNNRLLSVGLTVWILTLST